MKTKLLMIEDESAIRDMIRFALPEDKFHLFDAGSADHATRILADHIPDLILLDWMLPGKSGVDFIAWIKQQENLSDIPIIMLTAKAEESNKVKALMLGADDYITKPFSPKELIARITAVLRRGPNLGENDSLVYQKLVLDTNKHSVSINNEAISLSPTEYKMLLFFMRHPNKTYSRDQLMTRVLGGNIHVDDRTIDAQIKRLRAKLEPFGYQYLIKTIRGAGYQFEKNEQ